MEWSNVCQCCIVYLWYTYRFCLHPVFLWITFYLFSCKYPANRIQKKYFSFHFVAHTAYSTENIKAYERNVLCVLWAHTHTHTKHTWHNIKGCEAWITFFVYTTILHIVHSRRINTQKSYKQRTLNTENRICATAELNRIQIHIYIKINTTTTNNLSSIQWTICAMH